MFEHSSHKCTDEAKGRRRSRNTFQKRARKPSHENLDSESKTSTDCDGHPRIESGRSHGISPPTTSNTLVQWVTSVPPTSSPFVQWVTTCFLTQRKNRRKNHLNRRSKNSLEKLFKKQVSQYQSILVNSSERDQYAIVMEEALRRVANNLPDRDPSKDPG